MMRIAAGPVLLLLLLPLRAEAQRSGVPDGAGSVSEVRVTGASGSGRPLEARGLVRGDSLVVLPAGAAVWRTIPLSEVERVEIRHRDHAAGAWLGLWGGALAGAVLGGAVGLLAEATWADQPDFPPVVLGAAGGAVLGAPAGALALGIRGLRRWETVWPAGPAPTPDTAAAIRLRPRAGGSLVVVASLPLPPAGPGMDP